MSLRIAEDESGLTYTLEAILGIFIIIGAVIYATGNMPPMPHKTGEFSKVQLMNIGRDTIDLTLITQEYEIDQGGEPFEVYNLTADKYANINPGDTVNFTVYYVSNNELVNKSLNFNATNLNGTGFASNITANVFFQNDGSGNQSWKNVPSPSGIWTLTSPQEKNFTYAIQAYDQEGVSNFVIIRIGYYNFTIHIDPINGFIKGNVTDANGIGVPLTIRIWEYKGSNNLILGCSNCNPDGSIPNNKINWTGGNFSFDWSILGNSAGIFFVQAINGTGEESNMEFLQYPGGNLKATLCASDLGNFSCDSISVPERGTLFLNMSDPTKSFPDNHFYVNWQIDAKSNAAPDQGKYIYNIDNKNAKLNANVPSGVYYVVTCPSGCNNSIQSSSMSSNMLLVFVTPISTKPIGDTCVNATNLNTYTRRYLPPYVNYNLYLIGPNGSRFMGCPDFYDPVSGEPGELINGYPTAEAVTVSKLTHIQYSPTNVNNMTEYRMELWYK